MRSRSKSGLPRGLAITATLVAAGCLPRGQGPAGERILDGRVTTEVQFVRRASPDAGPRLVIWQARADGHGVDLLVAELPPPGSAAPASPPRRIADGVDVAQSILPCGVGGSLRAGCGRLVVDTRGRILVRRWVALDFTTGRMAFHLLAIDLRTGDTTDLGEAVGFDVSASGDRVLLFDDQQARVVDAGGGATTLPAGRPVLVGEDVFFLAPPPDSAPPVDPSAPRADDLRVLRADGSEQLVASDVAYFNPKLVAGGQGATRVAWLEVFRGEPGSPSSRRTLVDPTTLAEGPAPGPVDGGAWLTPSPDGRWVAFVESTDPSNPDAPSHVAFVDTTTGAAQTVEAAPAGGGAVVGLGYGIYFRPGHDEAWIAVGGGPGGLAGQAGQDQQDRMVIWRDGLPPTTVEGRTLLSYADAAAVDSPSPFTSDGSHWFSTEIDYGSELLPVFLGSADAPAGERVRLTSPGTGSDHHWRLPDGRLVVEAWTSNRMRNDITLVDPATGALRGLATGGNVRAVGAGRALAMLGWLVQGGSGDLTLIDVDGDGDAPSASTLAENAYRLDVEPAAAGGDALAPGTFVAFVVRNRLASPYDGLWVAPLP